MGLFSWWKGRRSGSPEPAKAAGGSAAEFAAAGSHGGGGGAAAAAAAGCGRDRLRVRVGGGVRHRCHARGILPRLRRPRTVPLGARAGLRRGRAAVPHRLLTSEREERVIGTGHLGPYQLLPWRPGGLLSHIFLILIPKLQPGQQWLTAWIERA
ncbi:hypothetical protein GUJ93_ZPchr0005g16075 [Zizania palustris]|uniref:Uncharacterized protein n=1 Tax=Zizania palustris TaxID=103762 RepID=A0A8J5S3J6_ZIZPA|nr:hypothetical protein GUJ93_ZPchr0005g16075 [Zizania palustris]